MTDRIHLSIDDIRALAKQERDMDSGALPFVLSQGERLAVIPEVMKHLGLESGQVRSGQVRSGQSVNRWLSIEITKAQTYHCRQQIERGE